MTTKRKIHIAREILWRWNSGNPALSFQSFCGELVLTQIDPPFHWRRNLSQTLDYIRLDRENEVNCKRCLKAHTAYLATQNLNKKPTIPQQETQTVEEKQETLESYINPCLHILYEVGSENIGNH